MNLKTQWLTHDQTKVVLNATDPDLKKYRRDNKLVSLTLEGKLHYRLDTILLNLGVDDVVTYESQVLETIAETKEVEVSPQKKEIITPKTYKKGKIKDVKFVSHASKEWAGVIASEDLPCFLYKKRDGNHKQKKSLEVTLVDIMLYNTTGASGTAIKAQLTFRSVQDPEIIVVLQLYPLIFLPGKVLQTFLNNFVPGLATTFENSLHEGEQRYSLWRQDKEQGDEVLVNQWTYNADFEPSLKKKEVFALCATVKQQLISSGVHEELSNPKVDKAFTSMISLNEIPLIVEEDDNF